MEINFNFDNKTGKIKAMNAVCVPPMVGMDYSYFKYLKEANIPYSRLHDVGGWFGGNIYVDIPNLFRDFDADENDPAAYDFTFTDNLLEELLKNNCEPYFRLGVTIENFSPIKEYRINPPKDFAKWARICEKVIRHYNEGWANGFEFGIKYWEIWNEPEDLAMQNFEKPFFPAPEYGKRSISLMWNGTKKQYFDLYETTAKHLKKCFGDSIKIGGYGVITLDGALADTKRFPRRKEIKIEDYNWVNSPECKYILDYLDEFLDFVNKNEIPLDFISWHSYQNVDVTGAFADCMDIILKEHGLNNVESHLTEWNTAHELHTRGTNFACASYAAMLISQQNSPTDICCFYDAKIGACTYGGLFNPLTYKPFCTYYPFMAFGEMLKLGYQAECNIDDLDGVYALGASDGKKKIAMLSNYSKESVEIRTNLTDEFDVYLINEDYFYKKTDLKSDKFTLEQNNVVIIKNYDKIE